MSKDLPAFKARNRAAVTAYVNQVFSHEGQSNGAYLQQLVEYDDHHFRAVFSPAYFSLLDGESQPSKSQWNNLKKKMKRHDKDIFLFKEHGEIITESGERGYYVDFGFFVY